MECANRVQANNVNRNLKAKSNKNADNHNLARNVSRNPKEKLKAANLLANRNLREVVAIAVAAIAAAEEAVAEAMVEEVIVREEDNNKRR
jgi:hypothetical protein